MITFKHLEGEIAIGKDGIYKTSKAKAKLDFDKSKSAGYWLRRKKVFEYSLLLITGLAITLDRFDRVSLELYAMILIPLSILLLLLGLVIYLRAKRATVFFPWKDLDQIRVYPSGFVEWVNNRRDVKGWRVKCGQKYAGEVLRHVKAYVDDQKLTVPKAWSVQGEICVQMKGSNGTRVKLSKDDLRVGTVWTKGDSELKRQSVPPKLALEGDSNFYSLQTFVAIYILAFQCVEAWDVVEIYLSRYFGIQFVDLKLYLVIVFFVVFALQIVKASGSLIKDGLLGGLSFYTKAEDIKYLQITGSRVIFGLEYKDGQIVDFEATARVKEELEALDSIYKDLTPVTF